LEIDFERGVEGKLKRLDLSLARWYWPESESIALTPTSLLMNGAHPKIQTPVRIRGQRDRDSGIDPISVPKLI